MTYHYGKFGVTVIWNAKWWKRPGLWLRGLPTKTVEVFEDCQDVDMKLSVDGSMAVDFIADVVEIL